MSVKDVELLAQRRQTSALLARDGVPVVLVRREKVATGTGGFKWQNPTPLPAQTFVLARMKGGQVQRTLDGEVVFVTLLLLAQWDADVKAHDLFSFEGRDYEIAFVYDDTAEYETRAEAFARG